MKFEIKNLKFSLQYKAFIKDTPVVDLYIYVFIEEIVDNN